MSDTKQRIAEYKKLLPGLKERVVAVALLLVISLTMVTTTTFAWLVLSRRPELTGVSTTIAANGNLEIALATGSVNSHEKPAASQIGDSFAREGQTIFNANKTWGNLINLSDPSYGLENLILRPAELNTDDLKNSPLYGAYYTEDGRISRLSGDFRYTAWLPDGKYFGISNDLGVRAISSVKVDTTGEEYIVYNNYLSEAKDIGNLNAKQSYKSITTNITYMNTLSNMMGHYIAARMSDDTASKNPAVSNDDVMQMINMYTDFLAAYKSQAGALASLANLQMFVNAGGDQSKYTPIGVDDIWNSTTESLTALGVQLSGVVDKKGFDGIEYFIADYNTISSDYETLITLRDRGGTIYWNDGIGSIVDNLVEVGTCTIDGNTVNSIIGNGITNATGYLSGKHEAVITNGIIYRFEAYTGGQMAVEDLTVSAKVKKDELPFPLTANINVSIRTDALDDLEGDSYFKRDLKYTQDLPFKADDSLRNEMAMDTYGLAIDFWVRTNAKNHVLVLEGNVLSTTSEVEATGYDSYGNVVSLYTVTIDLDGELGSGDEYTEDVYKQLDKDGNEILDENNQNVWCHASDHSIYNLAEGEEPIKKVIQVENVYGYEGDNRIWDDEDLQSVTTISATQGSGSCYIYYPETPEDQARSLKLLESMFVAFVDEDGNLLTQARMDTEHHYASNGRVIVPLVLVDSSKTTENNWEGNEKKYITALTQNEAMLITAIVYLEGSSLTNEDVLSMADIQGQLNIQFGAYEDDLDEMDNEYMQNQQISVSAVLEGTSFSYDKDYVPDDPATEENEEQKMITNVTVSVVGVQPKTVTAFFLRAINSTSGSREETFNLVYDETSGTWKAPYGFTAPGSYVLRSIQVDGVDYDLGMRAGDGFEYPKVEIEGFSVASLTWDAVEEQHTTIMTAENTHNLNLALRFGTGTNKMPGSVQGRFLSEDGTVANVNFKYNTDGTWKGTATFRSSGEYVLQYLVIDGEYEEIGNQNLWKYATVYLGMKAIVYTDSPTEIKLLPDEMEDLEKNLAMQVTIKADNGEELRGLSGARLVYTMKGAGHRKMECELVWDVEKSCYRGELDSLSAGPGIYEFAQVLVGDNLIKRATYAPTFTLRSPEPPSFVSAENAAYTYAPGDSAFINAKLDYSSTASVWGTIVKVDSAGNVPANATKELVQGTQGDTIGNTTTWAFAIPDTETTTQDGYWMLTDIQVWDYYKEDGTYVRYEITEEGGVRADPLFFDLSDKKIMKKVVTNFTVSFDDLDDTTTNDDRSQNFTGTFMQTHEVTGLYVYLRDFENQGPNKEYVTISDLGLQFEWNQDSDTYGHYKAVDALQLEAKANFTVELKQDETDPALFVQANDNEYVQYAGSYKTTIIYKINNSEDYVKIPVTVKDGKKTPANAPVVTVSSEAPTVTISAISPTGSNPTKITYTTKNLSWGRGTEPTFAAGTNLTSSFDKDANTATVYAVATADNSTQRHGNFTRPTLTLTVAGVDSSCTVKLVLPGGSADDVTFSRTGNGTMSGTLGKVSQIKSWKTYYGALTHTLNAYYGHGSQKITTMTVTRDGTEYTITLDKPIVINNPNSVNQ